MLEINSENRISVTEALMDEFLISGGKNGSPVSTISGEQDRQLSEFLDFWIKDFKRSYQRLLNNGFMILHYLFLLLCLNHNVEELWFFIEIHKLWILIKKKMKIKKKF